MMKTQIGLGVLSIPAVFDTLGLIPGVLCMLAIAIITTWSDYIVGVFKLRHPAVYGIDDAGGLIFGRPGREILGTAFLLCESRRMLSLPAASSFISLLYHRLDLRGRIWNARYLHRPQRGIDPWHLYRRLCLGGGYFRIHVREYPNAWSDLVVGMGWPYIHCHLKWVLSFDSHTRVLMSDDFPSLYCDDRCWSAKSSCRGTPGGTLVLRLQAVQEPRLH